MHPSQRQSIRRFEREYAECHGCGRTTDPDADVMGRPNPGDVVVEVEDGHYRLYHRSCHPEHREPMLSDYM
jgi:hypothetical protein